MSTRIACLIALAGGCRVAAGAPSATSSPTVPVVEVVGSTGVRFPVRVELAVTQEDQQRGLMHRRRLDADQGMLFVFPDEQQRRFWMHDTFVPLDMLFADATGRIVGIVHDATPLTDTPRGVPDASRYVLEVNGGWCAAHGIAAGDRLEVAAALSTAAR
jgi:uncharacterized membrane protein (UPF0127 family)